MRAGLGINIYSDSYWEDSSTSMTITILFFLVLGISFTCSLFEAIILSITPAFVAVAIKENRRSGPLMEHLIENVERPLSAILTLNTISHTLGSAAIAYQVQHEIGEAYVTAASFILTFMILIFSEILPKSLGANHWKTLAPISVYIIQAMIFALYPFVLISEWLNKKITKDTEEPEITRDEVIMTAELGVEEGELKNKESNIIKNLLMLDKIYVADIMTPRSVFFALDSEMTVSEVFDKYKPIRFSRIPVYDQSLDNITGLVLRYKIQEALSSDFHEKRIGELVTKISTIPEKMTVSQILDYFIKEKEHLALAVDEYGVVTGLVTLEDAVETLLGVEIVDELDSVEDMRKYALEQWQLRKQKLRRN